MVGFGRIYPGAGWIVAGKMGCRWGAHAHRDRIRCTAARGTGARARRGAVNEAFTAAREARALPKPGAAMVVPVEFYPLVGLIGFDSP
jgi:hypothetical protein